ncbi:substrate-binding domain-containing protein [Achromobacter denitrificans]
MKIFWRLAIILLCLSGLSACSDQDRPRIGALVAPAATRPVSPPLPDGPRIALLLKSLSNPYFLDMERGARRAQTEFGAKLFVRSIGSETAIDQQIQFIGKIIADQSADAIVLVPTDSTRLVPSVIEADRASIRVVIVDTPLDERALAAEGFPSPTFVGVDNADGAYRAASVLSAGLPPGSEVALMEGNSNALNTRARSQGARRAFAEARMDVVASKSAWTLEEAYEITGALLRDYPDIRGIYCVSDLLTLGVMQYLADRGITRVRVAGFDGIPQTRAALARGQMAATVDQRPDRQGYLAVKAALDLLAGKPVAQRIMVDTTLLTPPRPEQP